MSFVSRWNPVLSVVPGGLDLVGPLRLTNYRECEQVRSDISWVDDLSRPAPGIACKVGEYPHLRRGHQRESVTTRDLTRGSVARVGAGQVLQLNCETRHKPASADLEPLGVIPAHYGTGSDRGEGWNRNGCSDGVHAETVDGACNSLGRGIDAASGNLRPNAPRQRGES